MEAHGDPLTTKRIRGHGDLLRLLTYVVEDPATGCWNWSGATDGDGYGVTTLEGSHSKAHRALYTVFRGAIEAESLDHLCRNRACVNPDHLEPVSMQVNTWRGDTMAAHYGKRTHCDKGHEFTPANTIQRPEGCRRCRTCKNAAERSRWASGGRTPSRR